MTPLCEVTCYWCSLWLIWWSRRARGCGCQGIESRLPFLEVLHAGGGVPRGHMGDFSIFGQLVKESALREWTFVLLKRVSSTTIMNLLSLREDLHALVVPPSRSRILPAWSFSLDSLLNNRNCPLSPWQGNSLRCSGPSRKEKFHIEKPTTRSFTHCSKNTRALFSPQSKGDKIGYYFDFLFLKLVLFGLDGLTSPQGKGDKIGYSFDFLFLKPVLFGLHGLTSLVQLAAMNIGLFFGSVLPAGTQLLVLKPRRAVH